jgi:hypothetical protein
MFSVECLSCIALATRDSMFPRLPYISIARTDPFQNRPVSVSFRRRLAMAGQAVRAVCSCSVEPACRAEARSVGWRLDGIGAQRQHYTGFPLIRCSAFDVLPGRSQATSINAGFGLKNGRIQQGYENSVLAGGFDLSLVTSTPASLLHVRSGRRFPVTSAPRTRADGGWFTSPSGFTNYLHSFACKPGCQVGYFYRSRLKP